MKKDLPEKNLPENENNEQLNEMSDAEKLMSRHLHTEGDIITDEDIKNIKIKKDVTESNVTTGIELKERVIEEEE